MKLPRLIILILFVRRDLLSKSLLISLLGGLPGMSVVVVQCICLSLEIVMESFVVSPFVFVENEYQNAKLSYHFTKVLLLSFGMFLTERCYVYYVSILGFL